MLQRVLKLSVAGAIRTASYQERDHLVVPVVALVEGVVHAMNSQYPEFVPYKEFSRAPEGWNGRPVFLGHPVVDGVPVSGNSPELLQSKALGVVFNTSLQKKKLCMEAWIDIARANSVAPGLVDRVEEGDEIQISVGVLCETDDSTGEFRGKKYRGAWKSMVPDHLALLQEEDMGACNWEMGCGVRAAKESTSMELHMYSAWLESGAETDALLKTLRDIPQSERDQMPAADFAGPNRSFPIQIAEDVSAAAHSLGRAKGNRNEIKRKIIAIAYRKGFEAQLPDDWKKKADQKAASIFSRLMSLFRPAQPANEMGNNDLRRRLNEAVQEKEPGCYCSVEDFYPVTDPAHVVYASYDQNMSGGSYGLYERSFTLDADGVVTVSDTRIEVEPVLSYEPVEGASPKAAAEHAATKDAVAAAPCSCQEHAAKLLKESNMTKEAITKFLESATPEQLAALGKVIEPGTAAAAVVTTPVVAAAAAVEQKAEVKAATFEEVLATADEDTRASINEGIRVAKERKLATITALKATGRCDLTDAQLQAKSQSELDQLVKLAGSNVRAAIDFSANAAHVDANAAEQTVAAPPDLGAAIRAARGIKA